MPVRKLLLIGLMLIFLPLSWAGFRCLRAAAKIRHASEEIEQGLARLQGPSGMTIPDHLKELRKTYALGPEDLSLLTTAAGRGFSPEELSRCVGVGFHLRHPPFGVFGSPPARPLKELLLELEAVRRLARRGGLNLALTRIAEERAFAARLGSVPSKELAELRAELTRQEPLREPLADAFGIERLLLAREVIGGVSPEPGEPSVLRERPGWRDLWSWTLLRARALDELDRHFERVRGLSELPLPVRSAALRREIDSIQTSRSLLSPWTLILELSALNFDAEFEAAIQRYR